MASYTGSSLYAEFAGTEISGRYKTFSETYEVALMDAACQGDRKRVHVVDKASGGANMTILAETDGTALLDAVEPGTRGTLVYAPEGTASGKVKYSVYALVKNRKVEIVHDDLVRVNLDFTFASGITETSY